jgi:predicted nucleotidyltransferase
VLVPASSDGHGFQREKLLLRVGEAVAVLKGRFAVRRAVLFGSLVSSAWFTPDSDVDLAVEGLRPSDFWEAWRVVEDIIADRPVDLVEMETARPPLIKAIERYGVEL